MNRNRMQMQAHHGYEALVGYGGQADMVGYGGAHFAVGADGGRSLSDADAQAIAEALIMAKESKIVEPRGPGRAYEELLGFPKTKVCAGKCARIFTKPVPVLTKVNNLVIQSSIAPYLLVSSLKMGKFEMLVTGDPMPAEAFIPTASNWLKLNGLTLNPGVTASIEVENTGNSDLWFAGGFFVAVVE